MTRAVLEGVAFGLRDSLELMRSSGLPGFEQIRATGGGSKSGLWRRILAEVLDASVVTTSSSEGAAQGAATLAAVGIGWFPTVEDACRRLVEIGEATEPSGEASDYAGPYERYRGLYPALSGTFHAIGSGDRG
jgi:xylulokinase